jgi:DNA-binding SARP family transcriptional activator
VVRGVNVEARPAVIRPGRGDPVHVQADVHGLTLKDRLRGPKHGPLGNSPFGFVLLDGEGQVLSVNDRAAALLSLNGLAPSRRGTTCCALFCASGNTQSPNDTEARCLTRRALSAGKALPETRIEIRRNGVVNPVWVTAAPIEVADARVVLHVRPEDARDRRRRARPAAAEVLSEAPALRISTLGRTRVDLDGSDIGGEWLDQRPGQLLKYLICERQRVVTCDEIADALWPNAGPMTRNSVRHQIHVLRERLEPDRVSRSASRFIVTRRGGYLLDPDQVSLDAEVFETEIGAGLALFAQGDETASQRLERALVLYKGDLFAENLYAEWALEERDRLRELCGRGLRAMVGIARTAGDLDWAAGHARRLAAMEPFDMDVQREFIEICMRRGRRSEAMRRYAIVRKRIKREFGQDPDFTLSDLRV